MCTQLAKLVAVNGLAAFLGVEAALAAPGDFDASFGAGGLVALLDQSVILLPDGRFVINGGSEAGQILSAFDANGRADPAFGNGGETVLPPELNLGYYLHAGIATADGSLLFWGPHFDGGELPSAAILLRLTRDGKPDATFGTNGDGIVVTDEIPSSVVDLVRAVPMPDGGIAIAAMTSGSDWETCTGSTAVLRLKRDGSPDSTFGTNGWTEARDVAAICDLALFASRPDGTLVVADRLGALRVLGSDGSAAASFSDGGTLPSSLPGWSNVTLLPDGGLILVASNDGSSTRLMRITPAGTPDSSFGNAGVVDLDLGELASDRSDVTEAVHALQATPDGRHLYLRVDIESTAGEPFVCRGVARLTLTGSLDPAFGRDGLGCVVASDALSGFLQAQGSSGHPPLLQTNGLNLIRLRVDNEPSPGIISLQNMGLVVDESAGEVRITVKRLAGSDGAASVEYSLDQVPPNDPYFPGQPATIGADVEAASGRLDWADGDDSDRTILLSIVDDPARESSEGFGVSLTASAGNAPLIGGGALVVIRDSDAAAPTPAAPTGESPRGGGGSLSLLTCAALLLIGLRRSRPACTASSASRSTPAAGHGGTAVAGCPPATIEASTGAGADGVRLR